MPRPSRLLSRTAALVALGAAVALVAAAPSSAATAPRADYQLQDTLASVVGGAPALKDVAHGNTFRRVTVDRTANRTVLQYPKGSGLALSGALSVVKAGTYTVVLLYRPQVVDGAYHRILDLHGGVGDTGLYERNGALYAYPDAASTGMPITASAFSQIVLTRTSGGAVIGFVNGKKVLAFSDSSKAWLATDLMRFGKDNTSNGSTGEETGGEFARIRLYDSALPASEAAGLDRLPGGTSDLAVTYTDSPDPVQHGGYLSYTATVTDNGPGAATGVQVALTVPSGATYVGSSAAQGSCAPPASGRVVCTLGGLPLSGSAQVLLLVRAPAKTGRTSSTATVTATSGDPTHGNDAATQSTTVR